MFRGRALSLISRRGKAQLPDLPYEYHALEPFISADIMELHHSKHHATYVNNLNIANEQLTEASETGNITKCIQLANVIKFNGGGHLNHTIFWQNMSPNGGGEPEGALADAIRKDFGSFENFKGKMSSATVAVQGSGWGWLGYNKEAERLQIATCANQDPLEATTGLVPIIGIDVWEHAYYLQYKNVRPDYVNQFWNVANWEDAGNRFAACQ